MTDHEHGEALTIDDVMIGLGKQQVRAIKAEAALAEAEAARDEFEKSYVHFRAAYEQAEARVDQLTDTLNLRSDALNRTGASNDTLRATLAAVEKRAVQWGDRAYEHARSAESEGDEYLEGYSDGLKDAAKDIRHDLRAALADQEPARD